MLAPVAPDPPFFSFSAACCQRQNCPHGVHVEARKVAQRPHGGHLRRHGSRRARDRDLGRRH